VLSHYVGDASQPLHCSYLHHGVSPMLEVDGRRYPVRKESAEFKAFSDTPEYKIHSLYEEGMLEVDTPTVLASVNAALAGTQADSTAIGSGFDAAVATIKVMHDAQTRLSPQEIIDADDPTLGPSDRAKRLWANAHVRTATITSLAESVSLLANLWRMRGPSGAATRSEDGSGGVHRGSTEAGLREGEGLPAQSEPGSNGRKWKFEN